MKMRIYLLEACSHACHFQVHIVFTWSGEMTLRKFRYLLLYAINNEMNDPCRHENYYTVRDPCILYNITVIDSNFADDPYYCGLRARIPAFVQKAMPGRKKAEMAAMVEKQREREAVAAAARNGHVIIANGNGYHHPQMGPHRYGHPGGPPVPGHPMMWHAKSVDSGMGMKDEPIVMIIISLMGLLNLMSSLL
jgi:hypothetical protein